MFSKTIIFSLHWKNVIDGEAQYYLQQDNFSFFEAKMQIKKIMQNFRLESHIVFLKIFLKKLAEKVIKLFTSLTIVWFFSLGASSCIQYFKQSKYFINNNFINKFFKNPLIFFTKSRMNNNPFSQVSSKILIYSSIWIEVWIPFR